MMDIQTAMDAYEQSGLWSDSDTLLLYLAAIGVSVWLVWLWLLGRDQS